jgi:hypothetical protein
MNLSDCGKLHSLIKIGIRAKGLTGIEKLQRGGKLGRAEAIKAKCYDCMGGYPDGAVDCEDNSCPLYEYHPYRSLEEDI